VGLCVIVLVLSNDLGGALLYAGTFLIMFFAGTGRTLLTFAGLGAAGAGALASYFVIPHVKARVLIWQDPWAITMTRATR
jgi:cell division protein FtsW (lipid II flippase)